MGNAGIILPDIPRLYTALAEWLACMVLILYMKKRFRGPKLAVIYAAAFIIQSVFLVYTVNMEGILWIVCMLAAIFWMVLFLCLACDMNWRNAVYYGAFAFIMAETAASLEWQLYMYVLNEYHYKGIAVDCAVLIIVYGLIYTIYWRMNSLLLNREEVLEVDSRELWEVVIITAGIFFISNLGFVAVNTPFSGIYSREIFNIRTFADVAGLAVLYAFHVQWRGQKVHRELESIQTILRNQYIQYQQSQKSLDLIHYKYHDLKHQIIALRAEQDIEKRNEYLNQMEQEINNYGIQFKTGNKVLDTVLMSKGMECQQNDISFTCVIDGALFGSMDVMDICSIFGNALDNAIECEIQIADKEKRMIHVSAFLRRNFLIIRFENYYKGTLEFKKNLPVSTKRVKGFHGYGLKSLQYTVHKYKGEVDITAKDDWFCLGILIPHVCPETETDRLLS